MATLAFAVGSSHGPTNQTPPADWLRLGEGDKADPRYDYNEMLAKAKPGMEAEIALEKREERGAGLLVALDKLRDKVAEANVDVMVVVSNVHSERKTESQAVFGVLRADSFPVKVKTGERYDPAMRFSADRPKPVTRAQAGNGELANHLIDGLIGHGFDIACQDGLPDGAAVDDSFAFVYDLLPQGSTTPFVPFQLSRYRPYQATPARCVALGHALREVIESWDSHLRVGLLASGGLSHQVIDEELDQRVIKGLTTGDLDDLSKLDRDQLNYAPGTPEILNWVTVAAAMSPQKMTLVDYIPAYRSLAGTGHGLTYGYWS